MNFKGMIFDLDGTLVDSMYVWNAVDLHWLTDNDIPYSKELSHIFKNMSFSECANYVIQQFEIDKTPAQIMNEWNELALYEYAHNVKLKAGVRLFLEQQRGRGTKLSIATSCFPEACQAVLQNNDILEFFDSIIHTESVGKNKSFPDIYLLAAQTIGIKPRDCVVFEDISFALQGVRAAGMKFCAVYDAFSSTDWSILQQKADYFINSFEDLL